MMASTPNRTGPDDKADRENPGDQTLNPSGVSTDEPAEGNEEAAPKQPGSPQG
jgi:hypothetical protein